eukprot:CAMPEP_0202690424 /NCGR_PEP_ID=MMETSP1385-20130828/5405_1 /ASSEMBLY_ACC=CAM_ASM_000861 /TAXON_ID=933848 /ORGANISM="Elphidium margaritaceum" /LENGTH=527 /DNA_ID=CAMNT_0049345687 /DNA_START=49 /DNA_END=1629 /DNA_ORIENTATION=+
MSGADKAAPVESERSPLNQNNKHNAGQYTTIIKPAKVADVDSLCINTGESPPKTSKLGVAQKQKLNLFNKFSLTYINVVNYNQRRALYPFATFFSSYYEMDAATFAWVISAFHLGGFLAIFISPYMMHFKFSWFLIAMLLILAASNVLMVFWNDFAGLIVLRIVSGLVCTITWSEVTGSIGAFTDQGAERTTGIIITESSFTLTTAFYVVIGVILNELDVTWFWLIMAAMAVFGALLAVLLPNISLYAATHGNTRKMKRIQSTSSMALIPTTPGGKQLRESLSSMAKEKEQDDVEVEQSPLIEPDQAIINDGQQSSAVQQQPAAALEQRDDKFSLMACFRAYGTVYHLLLHFLLLFCMSTQFSAFSVCFGGWLVDTYSLNAAELGYFTMANTCGGVTALILAPLLSKYKPNIFGIIVGCMGVAAMTFIISMLVWTQNNLYVLVLISFYVYWVFSQVMFLNIIVCNLDFSPKGYESTSSLIFQMIARGASFIGTVVGPNVVNWISFPFLINVSCLLFILASLLYTAMY